MKRIAFLLAVLLLMTGCALGSSFERTPEEEQTQLLYISVEDTNFVGSIDVEFYGQAYTIDDRWEDEHLQSMVSTVKLDYPIDTLDELHTFAWALYDISMETELFEPTLLPKGAEHYADGIWKLFFSESEHALGCYIGPEASFLVSETDGHIITLRTEQLYLDPYASGRWDMFNGSDNLPTGEQKPFARITWLEEEYEDPTYPWSTYSTDDRYENHQWQDIAAGIRAQYPVMEGAQITDWAWDFCDASIKQGLFDPEVIPCFATHHNDGIWELIFDVAPFGSDHKDVRVFVLISDADGHVICVNP